MNFRTGTCPFLHFRTWHTTHTTTWTACSFLRLRHLCPPLHTVFHWPIPQVFKIDQEPSLGGSSVDHSVRWNEAGHVEGGGPEGGVEEPSWGRAQGGRSGRPVSTHGSSVTRRLGLRRRLRKLPTLPTSEDFVRLKWEVLRENALLTIEHHANV